VRQLASCAPWWLYIDYLVLLSPQGNRELVEAPSLIFLQRWLSFSLLTQGCVMMEPIKHFKVLGRLATSCNVDSQQLQVVSWSPMLAICTAWWPRVFLQVGRNIKTVKGTWHIKIYKFIKGVSIKPAETRVFGGLLHSRAPTTPRNWNEEMSWA